MHLNWGWTENTYTPTCEPDLHSLNFNVNERTIFKLQRQIPPHLDTVFTNCPTKATHTLAACIRILRKHTAHLWRSQWRHSFHFLGASLKFTGTINLRQLSPLYRALCPTVMAHITVLTGYARECSVPHPGLFTAVIINRTTN